MDKQNFIEDNHNVLEGHLTRKDWLQSADAFFDKLDQVTANIYNFSLKNQKTLKVEKNLRDRRLKDALGANETFKKPPIWSSSVQDSAERYTALHKRRRPTSASGNAQRYQNVLQRPQSAKLFRSSSLTNVSEEDASGKHNLTGIKGEQMKTQRDEPTSEEAVEEVLLAIEGPTDRNNDADSDLVLEEVEDKPSDEISVQSFCVRIPNIEDTHQEDNAKLLELLYDDDDNVEETIDIEEEDMPRASSKKQKPATVAPPSDAVDLTELMKPKVAASPKRRPKSAVVINERKNVTHAITPRGPPRVATATTARKPPVARPQSCRSAHLRHVKSKTDSGPNSAKTRRRNSLSDLRNGAAAKPPAEKKPTVTRTTSLTDVSAEQPEKKFAPVVTVKYKDGRQLRSKYSEPETVIANIRLTQEEMEGGKTTVSSAAVNHYEQSVHRRGADFKTVKTLELTEDKNLAELSSRTQLKQAEAPKKESFVAPKPTRFKEFVPDAKAETETRVSRPMSAKSAKLAAGKKATDVTQPFVTTADETSSNGQDVDNAELLNTSAENILNYASKVGLKDNNRKEATKQQKLGVKSQSEVSGVRSKSAPLQRQSSASASAAAVCACANKREGLQKYLCRCSYLKYEKTKVKPQQENKRPKSVQKRAISPKQPEEELKTEGHLRCEMIQAKLAKSGVKVSLHTLKKGLLAPTEYGLRRTNFTDEPLKQASGPYNGLLSDPSQWMPKEYRKLQEARAAVEKMRAESAVESPPEKPASVKRVPSAKVKKRKAKSKS